MGIISRFSTRFKYTVKNLRFGHIGRNSKVIKPMRIINKSCIYIGDNVTVLNDARMECCAGYNASIHIGDDTSIEQGCHIVAADQLEIGKKCVISAWVYISDCNHDYGAEYMNRAPLQVKKTRIDDHVFIGIGSKIMPGVHIGHDAIIGANAVVTKDVPPNEIWGGVPAKCIRNRTTNTGDIQAL